MLIPALRLARDERRGAEFPPPRRPRVRRSRAFIRHFLSAQYAGMIGRYKEAFLKALPHLSRQELTWRLHFVMGALSYTLAGTDALKLFAQVTSTDNDELLLQRLAPFLVAASRPGTGGHAQARAGLGRLTSPGPLASGRSSTGNRHDHRQLRPRRHRRRGVLAYHRANGLAWSIGLAAGAAALTFATGLRCPRSPRSGSRRRVRRARDREAAAPRARHGPIFGIYKKILPQISQTEQERSTPAASGGRGSLHRETGLEEDARLSGGAAFVGKKASSTAGRRAVRNAERVDITHNRMDLPPKCGIIREKGFLGIIIPKSFGASASPPWRTPKSSPRSARVAAPRP